MDKWEVRQTQERADSARADVKREVWRLSDWREAAGGMANATYHALAPAMKPQSVKVGNMRLILEAPKDWARRVGRAAP